MKEIFLLVLVSDYEDEDTENIMAFESLELLDIYMKMKNLHYKKDNEEQGYDWEKVDFVEESSVFYTEDSITSKAKHIDHITNPSEEKNKLGGIGDSVKLNNQ